MANQIVSQILLYLADFAKFIQKYTDNVGLPKLNYNWLIILFFIFAIFLLALTSGKSRMMLALLALYVAAFLEAHFIYFDRISSWFKKMPVFWVHIGLFLVIYIIAFAILNRTALKHRLTLKETSIFAAGLIAVLEIGFLASIILSYLPSATMKTVPSGIIKYFAAKNAQFWWAVVPLLALILLKRKKETSLD